MWHLRFFGIILAVLTLQGFMGIQTALAADPALSNLSMGQSQVMRGLDGSFQLAVMGNNVIPMDIPAEKTPEKAQPVKPAVQKPKATPKKASKPKKKKVKKAKVKKAPVKKPVGVEEEEGFLAKTLKNLMGDDPNDEASISLLQKSAGGKPEPGKNEGLLTKTLKSLMSDGDDKKKVAPKPKPQPQKTAGKKPAPEKKEDGLLTKTLKSLMGGDKKKEEQTAKKSVLDSLNMVPGSASKKKTEEQSKTAKSETKATLKDSFEKLIGVGNVKDKSDDQPAKNKEFAGLLGGGESPKITPKKAAPPRKLAVRPIDEDEEEQLESDRGGVKKGKNILKESFKTLVNDDKKKALAE
jgi:hypothetical protein